MRHILEEGTWQEHEGRSEGADRERATAGRGGLGCDHGLLEIVD